MKLAASGVDSKVVVWVREFLIYRTQSVRVRGQLFKEVNVIFGGTSTRALDSSLTAV